MNYVFMISHTVSLILNQKPCGVLWTRVPVVKKKKKKTTKTKQDKKKRLKMRKRSRFILARQTLEDWTSFHCLEV